MSEFADAMRHSPGLARLAVVRWVNQFGDGFFQAALGGAILFNPERQTEPIAIAVGFVVLLLPYSLIGPFIGTMLDRWDRRLVIVWAAVIRCGLVAAASIVLFASINGPILLLIALAAIGVSRFVLSGLSASLPNVVAQQHLVPANAVLVTLGAGFAGLGASASILVVSLVGEGDVGSGTATAVSILAPLAGGVAAWGFAQGSLGPGRLTMLLTRSQRTWRTEVAAVATGLATGARAVWHSPGVTTALAALGAHRITFGVNTLIMVLLLQDPEGSLRLPGGLAGFGLAIAATATGMVIAAVLMPFVIPRLGRTRTIVSGVILALAAQVVFVRMLDQDSLIIAAFLFGIAGQSIKLCSDAAMQIEIPDGKRGRVFALQDMVFNAAFVAAIAIAASFVAPDGRSISLVYAGAVIYALALAGIALNARRRVRNRWFW
ncbi:MFS transporter [Hoyosella altamirensis]|nr:MFS transporter [Hoyosella altamirensis]